MVKGLSLRSMCQDLGIPMKIEIQSDSSTANPLTDRLGAGQRTKHIDTRGTSGYKKEFKMETHCQESAHGEKLRRCWNEASLCFSTTTTSQVRRIGILLTMDPTLYNQDDGISTDSTRYRTCSTETDKCQR